MGTAFPVARGYWLTAGHNVLSPSGPCQVFLGGTKIKQVAVPRAWTEGRYQTWDVAILRVPRFLDAPFWPLGAPRTGPVVISGYVAGDCHRRTLGGQIVSLKDGLAWHDVPTLSGMSGSPLIRSGQVVGVHAYGYRKRLNRAPLLEGPVLDWIQSVLIDV